MKLDGYTLALLKSQMARAELILFTGSGFSAAARDRSGRHLPSPSELSKELWGMCFVGKPYDESASLGELFEVARKRHNRELAAHFEARLSVDANTVPEFYAKYFNLPWLRIYTLNVDDLPQAVARRYKLDRRLVTISATAPEPATAPGSRGNDSTLEVVHLNGVLPNPPDQLTFSETQYAERIANREHWYARCVADITCRPVVFIGTLLREAPLWQHMELRRRSYPDGVDRRPRALLITRTVGPAREELLRELKIEWTPGDTEEFLNDVLSQCDAEARQGHKSLGYYLDTRSLTTIPLVSDLAADRPDLDTEYLLGEEPHWSDILKGRAIDRTNDGPLRAAALEILEGRRTQTIIAVTGTAGVGKSTTLMNLALGLSADGIPVLWVDRDSHVTPVMIRETVAKYDSKVALAMDDAELFGRDLVGLVQDLATSTRNLLLALSVRSSRMEQFTFPIRQAGIVTVDEHTVPGLTDADVDKLIATLDKNNRLGVLKGKTPGERRRAFTELAGRQLLVAMIQATTGERFEEKARNELVGLEGLQRYVYSLACVTTALRHFLTRDEIALASGDQGADAISATETLIARHMLVSRPPQYEVRARHPVIANLVHEKLQQLGELKDVLGGLCFAIACKVSPGESRNTRSYRFLRRLINHNFMGKSVGVMNARAIYAELEGVLNFDYHYWLQRGSLEVERGDIKRAEHFLGQARSLAPDDFMVETECGYLQMRKAVVDASHPKAHECLREGIAILEGVIASRGQSTPYPFHVLGVQGREWVREGKMTASEARDFLSWLRKTVDNGRRAHPWSRELKDLGEQIQRDELMTVVRKD